MKKLVASVFFAVLLALAISTPLNAAVPVCRLPGLNAMDTNRQLGEGEKFTITDRPLVVNLRFKPTTEHPEEVGECTLPGHSEVAEKNGILMWVKICGNDEVNHNIRLYDVPASSALIPSTTLDIRDSFNTIVNNYDGVKPVSEGILPPKTLGCWEGNLVHAGGCRWGVRVVLLAVGGYIIFHDKKGNPPNGEIGTAYKSPHFSASPFLTQGGAGLGGSLSW